MYEEIKKIRIILKAYQVPLLNEACKVVMQTLHEAEEKQRLQPEPDLYVPRSGHLEEGGLCKPKNVVIKGPIPLPIKKRIYCVLRSPHVNKDSREHFEIRTHKKVIDIDEPGKIIITALRSINFSGGLCLEMKLFY
jgi:ribosomal protein S10